jgi:uncharacterized delta-60 repeat protein
MVGLLLSGSFHRASAQTGILDPTFGIGGKVISDFFTPGDRANAVAIQPDGRILVAGRCDDANFRSRFALARYNTNGSLDSSFGSSGKIVAIFSGLDDEARALALQPNGAIVVAGLATDANLNVNFALARFNPDGSPDASFGIGGRVTTDFVGERDEANAVTLQPDGRIVVAGLSINSALNSDFALARYNPDGSLDATFDADGKAVTDFAAFGDQANGVAIQTDGRIVAAGVTSDSDASTDFALARYNPNGSLDSSFDGDGLVITDFSSPSDGAKAVALQKDGRIVAAGFAEGQGADLGDFALARYNSNGSLDAAFGLAGRVITDFAGVTDSANALAIQADGRIVAAGSGSFTADGSDFALARYNPSGALDASFDTDGLLTTDFNSFSDAASGVAIQTDGRIVAVGTTFQSDTVDDFALARYGAGFDMCIQQGGNIFQFDSAGNYLFIECSTGFSIGGKGVITRRGCTISLQHNAQDRRVTASVDDCAKRGTASVQVFALPGTVSISDRNTTDNSCACR